MIFGQNMFVSSKRKTFLIWNSKNYNVFFCFSQNPMEKSLALSICLVDRKQFRTKKKKNYQGFAQDFKLFIIS